MRGVMMRRARRLLILLVVLFLIYGGASWIASSYLSRAMPSNPPVTLADAELHEPYASTTDGIRLVAETLAPKSGKPRGVVLLFHGRGGARLENRQPFLRDANYVSVAVDMRAHGRSGGERSTHGLEEAHDVRAVLHESRRRYPGLPLFGWGVSLGGAALCFAHDETKTLDGVILESVYARIDRAFDRRLEIVGIPRWLRWTCAGPYHVSAWRMGISPDQLRPEDAVAALKPSRVLLVTGSRDRRAPVDDVNRLAARLPGTNVFIVEDAHHENLWSKGGHEYQVRVLDFLNDRTPAAPR